MCFQMNLGGVVGYCWGGLVPIPGMLAEYCPTLGGTIYINGHIDSRVTGVLCWPVLGLWIPVQASESR